MKNKSVIQNRLLKAGVVAVLLLPSVNYAASFENYNNQFQTDLARVQGDIGAAASSALTGGAPDTSKMDPETKKIFDLLVTTKGMKEAIAQFDVYKARIAKYEKLKADKSGELSKLVGESVNNAKQNIAAVNAMNNPTQVAAQVSGAVDPSKAAEPCRGVDIGALKKDAQAYDQVGNTIQMQAKADGEADLKKAEKLEEEVSTKLWQEKMGKVGAQVIKLLPEGMESLLAATKGNDPKTILQFIQKNVAGIADDAQAMRVAIWDFLENPKTGVNAQKKKVKKNQDQVVKMGQSAAQLISMMANQVGESLKKVATKDADLCVKAKGKFRKQTRAMLRGYENLGVNEQDISAEDRFARDIKKGIDCRDNGQEAATEINSAADSCKKTLLAETKNIQNLRTLIMNCFSTVGESEVNSAEKVANGPQLACTLAARATDGQKEDENRSKAIDASSNPPQDQNAQNGGNQQAATQAALAASMNNTGAGGAGSQMPISPAMFANATHGGQPQQGRPTGR